MNVRTLRQLVAAGAAALATLAAAPAAHAGTYDVYSCKDSATGAALGPATPSGWKYWTSHPDESNWTLSARCDTVGGAFSMTPFQSPTGGSITGDASNPRFSVLQFVAPADTAIRAYELYRSMQVSGTRSFVLYRNEPNRVAEFCHANFGTCRIGDASAPLSPANRVATTFAGAGADSINLELLCDGPGCGKDASLAKVSMHAARFTLEENDRPTFTSPPSGSLLASGEVSGKRALDFVAGDVGSGVHAITVTSSATTTTPLASKVIDSGNGHCSAPKFAYVVPCPLEIDDSLEVDTKQFPDGEQTITIALEDAAGNQRTVTRTIDVHNAPAVTADPGIGGFSGTIAAGDTLVCDPGTFDPAPDRIAYSWLADGVAVPYADAATYVVRSQDVGRSLVCRVTATRGGGSTTVDSDPVGGSGQPGGPAPLGSCSGQPTGPKDPCGDYDGDGVLNKDDPDDDNDGTVDTADPSPFDVTVVAKPSSGGNGGNGGAGANGGNASVNVVLSGPTNGSNASNRARFVTSGTQRRTLAYGKSTTVTVLLRDENGRPVSGASVSVLKRMNVPGAEWVSARSAMVTDSDGRLRWRVPAGFSRTLRFAYKANLDNTEFQSTTDVVLTVRSKTTLKTNKRFFRNGQTIRFSGRLQSRPVPQGGVLIDLQAKVGRRWMTFKTTRSKQSGRWSAGYRFRATRGLQTYAFRARVRQDTGYPYAMSTSQTLKVKVRG